MIEVYGIIDGAPEELQNTPMFIVKIELKKAFNQTSVSNTPYHIEQTKRIAKVLTLGGKDLYKSNDNRRTVVR